MLDFGLPENYDTQSWHLVGKHAPIAGGKGCEKG